MGHYDGYSKEDFEALLRLLSEIKGKFLLSSYPSDILNDCIKQYGWRTNSFTGRVSIAAKNGKQKGKTERLTLNYAP